MLRFKWFFCWQDEAKTRWLEKMSQNGYHMTGGFKCFYNFAEGQPHNYVYRMDYQGLFNDADPDYLRLLKDAGWEHIEAISRWQYYRKEMKPGENAQIYTDSGSRIKGYQRLSRMWAIVYGFDLVGFLLVSNRTNSFLSISSPFNPVYIPQFVTFAALLFAAFCVIRIKRLIRQLQAA
jgi:hypothetical protein